MAPPRVLQVLTHDGVGGTEHMLALLIERLDRTALDTELVTLDRPGPIAERAARAGIRVRCLGGSGPVVALARLARLLAHERFDVVNAYGIKATLVARVAVRLLSPSSSFVCGVRGLSTSEHETMDGLKSRLVLGLERLTAPLVDVYDANSRGAVDRLAALGVPARKLHYIPNGVDVAAWPAAAHAPGPVVTVLCVARFVPRKRQHDLVEAIRLLVAEGVPVRAVFAGDGPSLGEVRSAAGGVESRVTFAGEVVAEDLRRLYEQADVFCLPSMWEGMPGAVMEAMAAGLPVVGTDVNGTADLVSDGETGLLVAPGDPSALARALRRLAADPVLRRRLGENGRREIEQRYSLERMVRDKQDLYLRVAGAA